jgi:hypothetical protein
MSLFMGATATAMEWQWGKRNGATAIAMARGQQRGKGATAMINQSIATGQQQLQLQWHLGTGEIVWGNGATTIDR